MRFDFSKIELHDVVLTIGVLSSIIGASLAYNNNTNRLENAIREIADVRVDVGETKKTNTDQSLLLKEISVNLTNLADTVKDLKRNQDWSKHR